MRMTAQDLIDELKKNPNAPVSFQHGLVTKNGTTVTKNHVARVDNFGHSIVIVIENGV